MNKKNTKISNKKKMAFQISGIILIGMIAIVIILLFYFYKGDIESKPPKIVTSSVHIKQENYKNRKVFLITPKEGTTSDKVILYIHGGSYMAELSGEHWSFFEKVIEDTGATLIVPDYPLTPQYKYTDVLDMMIPLYQKMIKQVKKEDFILLGDSAGGGIALALLEKAGLEELEQPSKTILISPWLDASMTNIEMDKVQEKDKILNKELLRLAGINYAGGEEELKNYLISPIYGPLEKLENIIIYTGTSDILNPDVHKLQKLAKEKRSTNYH